MLNDKQKIYNKKGILVEQQKLLYNGEFLEDSKTIQYYDIQMNSTIHAQLSFLSEEISNKIKIKLFTGKILEFEYQPREIIEDLKFKIENQEGIYPEQQILYYGDKILDNKQSIKDYNILQNSTILLAYRSKVISQQIIIKTLNEEMYKIDYQPTEKIKEDPFIFCILFRKSSGDKIVLNAQKTDSIKDIKEQIEKKEGILYEKQNLQFNGQKLKDEENLQELPINNGSTLYLLINEY